jgi:general secretion pathway protein I
VSAPRSLRRRSAGFTLVEVMLALAILGMALVMLMRSAASSLFATSQAQMLGVVTDLARGKMYDLEEQLAKDGFNTADQKMNGDFTEEGWTTVEWEAIVEQAELPNLETVKEVGKGASADGGEGIAARTGAKAPRGGGSGSGSGSEAANSTTGFIEQFYSIISDLLKVSLRKVTLTVKWKVVGHDRDMKVITYVTDPAAMVKAADGIIGAFGGAGGGSGEDEGSGSGTGGRSGGGVPRTSPTSGGSTK